MRPQGPTFFPLGGRAGWRVGSSAGVSVGARLRLEADPAGPLALGGDDESLGGLVLPRGLAFDSEGTLYLLGRRHPGVRRFDAERREFVALPAVGAVVGGDVRQFYRPANIAVAGHNLYVADSGNCRVQVFALGTLAVRHVWGPWDEECRAVGAQDGGAWEPADMAAHAGLAYVLDARNGRLYTHTPGTDCLRLLIESDEPARRWSRVALDREGRIYLFDAAGGRLDIYDRGGVRLGSTREAGDVREHFDPPAVRLSRGADGAWRFCLPESLTRLCERRAPADPPTNEVPLGACAANSPGAMLFDREGARARREEEPRVGPPLYGTEGTFRSKALDSQIYRCQWHRVELELGALTAGTRVEVYTYADAQKLTDEDVAKLPAKLWRKGYAVTGQLARPPRAKRGGGGGRARQSQAAHDFLVQSPEGQYLWLKVVLGGDGYATPEVMSASVHYPRESYVGYLPAVYASDDESRWFLERYLSIFQTEWDELERRVGDIAALFDPEAVPAGQLLEWLASWFALPLEGTWGGEQKRRLLEAVAPIYFGRWKVSGAKDECLTEIEPERAARRGTREGLRRFLQVYLQNITGLDTAAQGGFPQIVEGFRERQRFMLSSGRAGALGAGAPLWGPSAVGRLQLGVFAREGEVRLVSTGDPERDLFHEYAHRFSVFVPSSWVRTRDDEEMLRRALSAEKPAHTAFDLCLVEPRFRVGVQSTVGVDTVIGALPRARLACLHDANTAPSRPPRHRLGYDMILSAPPGDRPTLRLGREARAGVDAFLT